MGHEDVIGTTYEGTTRKHLEALVRRIVEEHQWESGSYHSVRTWYDVLPGVTTPRQFFTYDDDTPSTEKAQLIYAKEDVKAKTFRLTLPVKNLDEDLSYERLAQEARSAAEARGLIYDRFILAQQEGEVMPGVTGTTKITTTKGKGAMTSLFQVVNATGQVVATAATQGEAEETAATFVTKALGTRFTSSLPTYTIQKVTRRAEGPLSQVSVTISRGKAHLEVTGLQVKAGARAAGWAVSLDCHH